MGIEYQNPYPFPKKIHTLEVASVKGSPKTSTLRKHKAYLCGLLPANGAAGAPALGAAFALAPPLALALAVLGFTLRAPGFSDLSAGAFFGMNGLPATKKELGIQG